MQNSGVTLEQQVAHPLAVVQPDAVSSAKIIQKYPADLSHVTGLSGIKKNVAEAKVQRLVQKNAD